MCGCEHAHFRRGKYNLFPPHTPPPSILPTKEKGTRARPAHLVAVEEAAAGVYQQHVACLQAHVAHVLHKLLALYEVHEG